MGRIPILPGESSLFRVKIPPEGLPGKISMLAQKNNGRLSDDLRTHMEPQQETQEQAYRIPYHYLPVVENGRFSQHQYWSWGYRYLGRLQIMFDILEGLEFTSLLDVGCGDGRFLHEVEKRFSGKRLRGIDYSERAIHLARRMSPHVNYERMDIRHTRLTETYDVVTLLEVIEHIPLDVLPGFMEGVARTVRPGGWLLLTVPHINQPLDPRHYQHFDSARLRKFLESDYELQQCEPFDHLGFPLRLLYYLLGGSGRNFIITQPALVNFFYRYYLRHGLRGKGEKKCRRIACLARRKTPV